MESETPSVGNSFPAFCLPDSTGTLHRLEEYQGKYVVLYVYPKDNTPGCTREACEFKEITETIAEDVVILGLSRDSAESHQQFIQQYELPFALLSDPEATFLREIGSFGEKKQYGKVTEGIKRQTFIIGSDGQLLKSWKAVKVDGHAAAVASFIERHKKDQQC